MILSQNSECKECRKVRTKGALSTCRGKHHFGEYTSTQIITNYTASEQFLLEIQYKNWKIDINLLNK